MSYTPQVSGPQGNQGNQGLQGVSASYWDYKIDGTTVPPASGDISYNNVTQISSTIIYLNNFTSDNYDIAAFLTALTAGYQFSIQDANNSANFQTWLVTSPPTANTGYYTISVSMVSSGGTGTTNFPNNHAVILIVNRIGAQGPQGPQGQGVQTSYFIQGNQFSLGGSGTGVQNITGLQTGNLVNNGTYEIHASIGTQVTSGTQGIQLAIQCSVPNAVVSASFIGSQSALATTSSAGTSLGYFTGQGILGPQFNQVTANGIAEINGIVITPSTGTPIIGIQSLGVQSGAFGWIKSNSYLKVTRIS